MATFCLLLAVAAYVLTGAPSLCHGSDRPPVAAFTAFYRSPIAGGGNRWLVGPESVWSMIGREADPSRILRGGDAAPPGTAPCQRTLANAHELMVLETLLTRYRKYMVDEFARFDDVCSLLYADDGEAAVPGPVAETYNDSVETSLGQAFAGHTGDDTGGSGRGKTANAFRKDDTAPSATLRLASQPLGDSCSSSAAQFYRCLQEDVNDAQLTGMIHGYLQTTCSSIRGDPSLLYGGNNLLDKRDGPRYVSKQKFHSWGGKRSNDGPFGTVYPWGGKRTAVRPHKQPKVVIRNPFHSWGGKRSDPSASDASDVAQ